MELPYKIFLTIVAVLIVVVVRFVVTPGHVDKGRWWKLGTNDPVYLMFYDSDGRFRKNATWIVVVIMLGYLSVIWFLL
jgi:hypothetical protein